MSLARKIGKQAYIYFIGKIIVYLVNLGVLVLLARVLGSTDYGIFSLATTLLVMFYAIFNFGIESPIAYYIPKFDSEGNKEMIRKVFDTAMVTRIATGFIGSIILYLMSDFFEAIYAVQGLGLVVKIFSFGFFGYSIIYLAPSVFQAFKKFKDSTISDIVISIVKIVCILLTINLGLYYVTAGFTISLVISGFIILLFLYKRAAPKVKRQGFALKTILKYSAITYLGAVSIFIINSIGNLLVGSLPIQVSFLSIGHKIGMLIILPASSLAGALFPNISGLKEKQKIKQVYNSITKYALLVTAFFSFYIMAMGGDLISFVFGDSYNNADLVISTLMIGYFLYGAFVSIQVLQNGIKKPGQVTIALIIQGLISLIGTIILAPLMQGVGAAIAFGLSNLCFGIYLITRAMNQGYSYNFNYFFKILITALAASTTYLLPGLLIKTFAFGAIFLIAGFVTGALRTRDFKLLWSAVKFSKKYIK